jgi:hypothetical protein
VKQLFLAALVTVISGALYAQDSSSVTQPSPSQSKKNAKRERINNLLRMEEEGDLIFNKHSIFGIRLATDGYGINYEKGKFKTPTRTLLFEFELNEKKSPKENRVSSSVDNFNFSSVVLYKLNNLYSFKIGIGQQYLIGGKGNKNGVAVTALYAGGISIGMLKPYYIDAVARVPAGDSAFRTTFPELVKADSNGNNELVSGAAGFTVGWGHLSIDPGIHVKTAMRFDYGRLNPTVSAIEVGLTGEFYANKVPLVMFVPQKQFFFNAYVSILFGSRK